MAQCTFDSLWSALFNVALIGHVLAFVVWGVLLPALRSRSLNEQLEEQAALAQQHAAGKDQGEYEFTPEQEKVLRGVKRMMQKTGQAFGALCVLTCCDALVGAGGAGGRALPDLAAQISDGVDWGFFSFFLFQAKNSFKAVYRTSGSDITNLMGGMTQLFLLFKRMHFVLTIVIGKSVAVALLHVPMIAALVRDLISGVGGGGGGGAAGEAEAPMSRPKVLGLLCLELAVLTGAGYYGVLQDEKSSSQEAQIAAAAADGEEEEEHEEEAAAAAATPTVARAGPGEGEGPAAGGGLEKPKSQ